MIIRAIRPGHPRLSLEVGVTVNTNKLVIPAEHHKCKHVHVVPLVPQAVEILENIYRGGKGDYILSTTDGEKPIRGIAKYYEARLPRAIQAQTNGDLALRLSFPAKHRGYKSRGITRYRG
jgi:hypothetical protein